MYIGIIYWGMSVSDGFPMKHVDSLRSPNIHVGLRWGMSVSDESCQGLRSGMSVSDR